jgi:phosphoglycerol transferase MdoB-like AlkP superfamily enzyme
LVFTPVPPVALPPPELEFDLRPFLGIFPIFHPQPLNVFTTFGVTAAVSGTRMKINDLCIAYASASWVQIPIVVAPIVSKWLVLNILIGKAFLQRERSTENPEKTET